MQNFTGNTPYPEYNKEIKGLCPLKDSCDTCRNARKNDKEYQEWLLKKWRHEAKIENQRTLENAREFDRIGGFMNGYKGKKGWKGNESAVQYFQANKHK
jgi:hypothetical protein